VTRLDRSVVLALVVILGAIGAALAIPRQPDAPQVAPTPEPTPAPAAIYREGVVGTADSVTPVTARSRAERMLVGLVFSGLVKLGAGTSYAPDLAESWSVDESGKVWTFRIRDDATWQDGVPVTSDDVVYTVEALKSPDASGAMASAWADVTVEALDEHTVAFTLGTPIGGVLALATQPLLPAHLLREVPFADLADSDFARAPVGSGPFILDSLDETHAVLLPAAAADGQPVDGPVPPDASGGPPATPTPRPSVAGPGPYFGGIDIRFYPDEAGLASAFEAGDIDAAAGLSAEPATALAALDGVTTAVYPTTSLSTVLLNLRPAHRELRDPKVRTALLQAIDRDALARDILHGAAAKADALVPPDSWAFDAVATGTVPFDPQAAATALKAAGWTRKGKGSWIAPGQTQPYRLEILSVPAASNPRLAAIAADVRDAWKAAGFDARLVPTRAADLATALRAGTFTAAVVDIAEGLEPDLYSLLASSQVRASGTNLAGYQDRTLDPLLEAARKPGTPDERMAAWKALLGALATRMPILPLVWNDDLMLVRGLEGITPRLIAAPGDRYWDVLAWRLAADR
jgi:peptide/nickel transport system substrate-binding protein